MLCHFLYFPDASVIAFLLQFHHVETDPKRIPLLWWLFISLRKQRKVEPLLERQCSREQKEMGEIQKLNEPKFQLGCLMMISVIILLSISFNVPSIMWQNCPNWCENSDWNDWKSYWKSYWSYWIHSEKSCFEMGRKWSMLIQTYLNQLPYSVRLTAIWIWGWTPWRCAWLLAALLRPCFTTIREKKRKSL